MNVRRRWLWIVALFAILACTVATIVVCMARRLRTPRWMQILVMSNSQQSKVLKGLVSVCLVILMYVLVWAYYAFRPIPIFRTVGTSAPTNVFPGVSAQDLGNGWIEERPFKPSKDTDFTSSE